MTYRGRAMYDFAANIFPICRSLTGDGIRETLRHMSNYVSQGGAGLTMKSIPSGTSVFDWTVPKEWNIREAYIEDENGHRVIDMQENNLHVVGYSAAVDRWVGLDELKRYIYTQPDQPEVIPYVTSYYEERYGFCMSEWQKKSLLPGRYHMVIDSELFDGKMDYGELILPGQSEQEIFFSTYVCHPSMANNECSGPALMVELIRYVKTLQSRKYTYRFVVAPETIGAIAYLATENHLEYLKKHMKAGFVLSCVGDDRTYSYMPGRRGDTLADRVLRNVLLYHYPDYKAYSFLQRASDERQYTAPGVDLPLCTFSRSLFRQYPEYHTSADNMDLISPSGLQGSYDVMTQVIDALEANEKYQVTTLCEPQLGKRGLYPTLSQKGNDIEVATMCDLIAYADGEHDLIDISNLIHVSLQKLIPIVNQLVWKGVIAIK